MKNGFGLYDMAGNAAEWLWDSYYTEVTATTEYLDDNYKGPDLGLGTDRYYAAGRFEIASGWDSQTRATATFAGTERIFFSSEYGPQPLRFTDGTNWTSSRTIPQVGLRTVRGR
jgi:hypothetical protein